MSAQLAAERAAGGRVDHLKSTVVVEIYQRKVIWDGIVEVYRPEANSENHIYVWAMEGECGLESVAVLGSSTLDCPLAAERVWLACQSQSTLSFADE
jgi:hypothetical protein